MDDDEDLKSFREKGSAEDLEATEKPFLLAWPGVISKILHTTQALLRGIFTPDALKHSNKRPGNDSEVISRPVDEPFVRKEIALACRSLAKILARNGKEKEISALRRKVIRLLRMLLGQTENPEIQNYLMRFETREMNEQLGKTVQELLEWTGVKFQASHGRRNRPWPPSANGVEFIENPTYRRTKMIILHRIACSIKSGVWHSRGEIEDKIEKVRKALESGMEHDPRFGLDQLLCDLNDIGYLKSDGRRAAFCRKGRSKQHPSCRN